MVRNFMIGLSLLVIASNCTRLIKETFNNSKESNQIELGTGDRLKELGFSHQVTLIPSNFGQFQSHLSNAIRGQNVPEIELIQNQWTSLNFPDDDILDVFIYGFFAKNTESLSGPSDTVFGLADQDAGSPSEVAVIIRCVDGSNGAEIQYWNEDPQTTGLDYQTLLHADQSKVGCGEDHINYIEVAVDVNQEKFYLRVHSLVQNQVKVSPFIEANFRASARSDRGISKFVSQAFQGSFMVTKPNATGIQVIERHDPGNGGGGGSSESAHHFGCQCTPNRNGYCLTQEVHFKYQENGQDQFQEVRFEGSDGAPIYCGKFYGTEAHWIEPVLADGVVRVVSKTPAQTTLNNDIVHGTMRHPDRIDQSYGFVSNSAYTGGELRVSFPHTVNTNQLPSNQLAEHLFLSISEPRVSGERRWNRDRRTAKVLDQLVIMKRGGVTSLGSSVPKVIRPPYFQGGKDARLFTADDIDFSKVSNEAFSGALPQTFKQAAFLLGGTAFSYHEAFEAFQQHSGDPQAFGTTRGYQGYKNQSVGDAVAMTHLQAPSSAVKEEFLAALIARGLDHWWVTSKGGLNESGKNALCGGDKVNGGHIKPDFQFSVLAATLLGETTWLSQINQWLNTNEGRGCFGITWFIQPLPTGAVSGQISVPQYGVSHPFFDTSRNRWVGAKTANSIMVDPSWVYDGNNAASSYSGCPHSYQSITQPSQLGMTAALFGDQMMPYLKSTLPNAEYIFEYFDRSVVGNYSYRAKCPGNSFPTYTASYDTDFAYDVFRLFQPNY